MNITSPLLTYICSRINYIIPYTVHGLPKLSIHGGFLHASTTSSEDVTGHPLLLFRLNKCKANKLGNGVACGMCVQRFLFKPVSRLRQLPVIMNIINRISIKKRGPGNSNQQLAALIDTRESFLDHDRPITDRYANISPPLFSRCTECKHYK